MVPENCFHKHFLTKLSHWRQKNKSMRHSTGWNRLKTRSPPSTRPIPSFLQSQALDNESHAERLWPSQRGLPGKLGTGILLTCPISTANSVLQWRDSIPPSYGKTQEIGDVFLTSPPLIRSTQIPRCHILLILLWHSWLNTSMDFGARPPRFKSYPHFSLAGQSRTSQLTLVSLSIKQG